MEIIDGLIEDIHPSGKLDITAHYQNIERMCDREYKNVKIVLEDGRTLSHDQQKKAHALINDISDWTGFTPEYIKRHMKQRFIADDLEGIARKMFSLSNCDMTTAREFISHLIDFMVEHDVPSKVPLHEQCEDIERYVYACLMHKTCAICGKRPADLHHFDQIGMGNSRVKMSHIGLRVISLCRVHHNTAHSKGKEWLTNDLHLTPIPLTKEIGKVYKLTRKNLEG